MLDERKEVIRRVAKNICLAQQSKEGVFIRPSHEIDLKIAGSLRAAQYWVSTGSDGEWLTIVELYVVSELVKSNIAARSIMEKEIEAGKKQGTVQIALNINEEPDDGILIAFASQQHFSPVEKLN